MSDTSMSLFDRLRVDPDAASWQRLVELYTPLIRIWLRRHTVPDQDVDDLVQDTLAVVVRKLPEFKKEPRVGAFRRWLRTITVNCLRDFWRGNRIKPLATGNSDFGQVLDQLEDPESGLSLVWDREHDEHVTRRLLEMIRPRFEAKTWQAFQRVALEGAAVDRVAADLGVTANAIFIAKSRVMKMLREEGQGLLD